MLMKQNVNNDVTKATPYKGTRMSSKIRKVVILTDFFYIKLYFFVIAVSPQIVEVDRPIAEKDSTAVLRCVATSSLPVNISWARDNKDVTKDPRFTIQNGTLLIKKVASDDAGVYMCTAMNKLGSATRAVTLHVHSKFGTSFYLHTLILYHSLTTPFNAMRRIGHVQCFFTSLCFLLVFQFRSMIFL